MANVQYQEWAGATKDSRSRNKLHPGHRTSLRAQLRTKKILGMSLDKGCHSERRGTAMGFNPGFLSMIPFLKTYCPNTAEQVERLAEQAVEEVK
jgi:hypothetical protein